LNILVIEVKPGQTIIGVRIQPREGHMRVKTIMLLCFILSQFAFAQDQSGTMDRPQGDLAALRTDVRTLQVEQQQIINQLSELKQILQGNGRPPLISSLSVRGETFRGYSGARVAIIEYADFECPYCGEYERKTFPQLLRNYIETGKVKFFYRDLPLPGHARAMPAARAARCAGEQGKYWEMHDSLFATQNALSAPALLDRAWELGLDTEKFTECQSSEKYTADIQKNLSEAQKMGIGGTPTFFLGGVEPGGDVTIEKRFEGAAPFDVFKSELDALLASKSQEAASAPLIFRQE
jgi:protein-disulfide isomerase